MNRTFIVGAMLVAGETWAQAAQGNSEELPNWFMPLATGIGVLLGLVIQQARQKKKNAGLWEKIEPVLRGGPKTLQEIADAVGMSGFYARGKVVMALTEKTSNGQIEVLKAPEGTPQLEKVKFIKYRLKEVVQ